MSPFHKSWSQSLPRVILEKCSDVFKFTRNNFSTSKSPNWATSTNNDPIIIFPKVKEGLKYYDSLFIEIAATTQLKSSLLVVYLADKKYKFSEEKKLSIMIKADGDYHPYLINIPENIAELPRQYYKFIRIDPLDCRGEFSIKSVQLLSQEISPKFDRKRALVLAGEAETFMKKEKKQTADNSIKWIENNKDKPHFLYYRIPVDDVEYEYIFIAMAAKTQIAQATVRINFYDESGSLTENYNLETAVDADGFFHDHEFFFPKPSHSLKKKAFHSIRISPIQESGSFCIKCIKLVPKSFRKPSDHVDTSSPILYIHIPKSAGNTVNQLLMKYLPQETILECRKPGTNLVEFGKLDKYALITGHFGHKAVELFERAKPRICTILRHPLDQVTSFYYYLRAQPLPSSKYPGFQRVMELVHSESLIGFVSSDLPNVRIITDNHQTWKIGAGEIRWGGIRFIPRTREMLEQAKRNLHSYKMVGIQEDLLNSVILMSYSLNLPVVEMKLPRMNITKHRRSVIDLTMQEREAITACNLLDVELYNFSRELFRKQLEDMVKNVGEKQYHQWKEMLQTEETNVATIREVVR